VTARRVRIGIDVGGTFTDAVAVDAGTLELVGQAKVRTTHRDEDGVARGIVEALEQLLEAIGAEAADVGFLAHGTTQATNALLEGDVASVGVVGTGRGLEGRRTARLVKFGRIELAPGRYLPMSTAFTPASSAGPNPADLVTAIGSLQQQGAQVVVGAEAFSVDDPAHEVQIMDAARDRGLLATGTHEITKLYGLRRRVRTAVVNASILPRMLETADVVGGSIRKAGITAPLMVMRCDGGVMSLDEMRRRPLLTILSGPAAGVAGALMSERVGDGVFLETGGTSTDISVIKQGRVAVRYAEIGGHDTYLSSLDVRTVGIGGGSMIRFENGGIVDVGPRSAHIGGYDYCCFADPDALRDARLVPVEPVKGDPRDYLVVEGAGGRFALTVTCAANLLGLVPPGDYAYVDQAAARRGFEVLAAAMGGTPDQAAAAVLEQANAKVGAVVEKMIRYYQLDRQSVVLIGGGGGAATVTPHLGGQLDMSHRIAAHNEVISPIGVALALVREEVERIVPSATQQDVLAVRGEAERAVLAQGAAPASVEVDVEIDPRRNVVRAVATGATELRTRDLRQEPTSGAEAAEVARQALQTPPHVLRVVGRTDQFRVYGAIVRRRGIFGWLGSHTGMVAVVHQDGGVAYVSRDAVWTTTQVSSVRTGLEQLLAEHTNYSGGGPRIPPMRMILGGRIVNLAGLVSSEQVLGLAETDLFGRSPDDPVILVVETSR
jgi:N-methylhydantoinase A/oxoprolinase/acetone carboxylase beta subunit